MLECFDGIDVSNGRSVHTLPAAIPKPSNNIGLGKPTYSISWDLGLPQPTEEPEAPEPAPLYDDSHRALLHAFFSQQNSSTVQQQL